MLRTASQARIRLFSVSARRSLFGFNREFKPEIIEKQDEIKFDSPTKIKILDEKNSANYKPFDAERDMPGFKINQWKQKVVKSEDIESTYNEEDVSSIMSEAYLELQGLKPSDFENTSLHDLQFRFQYCKLLQQKLGFDISDYTISRSHTLQDLFGELKRVITHRWSSERNPNAIVLRPEDFAEAPNVYLNQELLEADQQKKFEEILAEAQKGTPGASN